MHLGTPHAQGGRPLGALPRRIQAEVFADPVTIGFRASGKMYVLHATPAMVEIRHYGRAGACKVLATYPGGRSVACEAVNDQLTFSVDNICVFSEPAAKDQWAMYDGRGGA